VSYERSGRNPFSADVMIRAIMDREYGPPNLLDH
jgi:hypothetical protein